MAVVKNKINYKEKFSIFFKGVPIFFKSCISVRNAYVSRAFKCIFAILFLALLTVLIPLPNQIYLKNHNIDIFKEKNVQEINTIYNMQEFDTFKALDLNWSAGIMYTQTVYGKDNLGNIEISYTDDDGILQIMTVIVDTSIGDQAEAVYYDYTKEFDTKSVDDNTQRSLLIFYNTRMYIRKNLVGNYFDYPAIEELKFSEMTSASEIGDYLVEIMTFDYLSRYSYSAMFSTFILPLALAFILFEVLKHKDVMFKYKHFINIAATSSIIPALIVIVLELIFPKVSFFYLFDILFVISYVTFIVLIHKNHEKIMKELE